jgi:hypothetical protein
MCRLSQCLLRPMCTTPPASPQRVIYYITFLASLITDSIYLPEAGVLDEPASAKPAPRSSDTGPSSYKGWTQFQPM